MSFRAVVVTYNSADVIERCLRSCGNMPVTVADNASTDATVELIRGLQLPNVTLIANKQNAGFAGAVNQAVEATTEPLILLLNPDVELVDDPEPLAGVLGTRQAGLATGRLLGEDGRDQDGFAIRRFPTPAALAFEALGLNRLFTGNPVNLNYRYAGRDWNIPGTVEQPAGAFLAFRKDVWLRLGGFDERFHPVWFEDVDFCLRASQNGFRICYLPTVRAKHAGGHSVLAMAWECREVLWYASLLKYASKHFRPLGRRAVGAAVAVGAVFRAFLSIARKRSLKPTAVHARVFRLGAGCLFSGGVDGGKFSNHGSGRVELDKIEHRELGNTNHLHVL
jgi:N-acetylglucosaminyl-diphospho-decaprenol L-rhamnosyltransferase